MSDYARGPMHYKTIGLACFFWWQPGYKKSIEASFDVQFIGSSAMIDT